VRQLVLDRPPGGICLNDRVGWQCSIAMHSMYASTRPGLGSPGQVSLPRPMVGEELQLAVEGLSVGAVSEWVIGQQIHAFL
jgi:hypothetical protein